MSAFFVVVVVAIVLICLFSWVYRVKKYKRERLLRSRVAPGSASSNYAGEFGTGGQSSTWPDTLPDVDSAQRRAPPRYSPKRPTSTRSPAHHHDPSLYDDETIAALSLAADGIATTSAYSGPPETARLAFPRRPAPTHTTTHAHAFAYRNSSAVLAASRLPVDVEVPEARNSSLAPEPQAEAPPPYSRYS